MGSSPWEPRELDTAEATKHTQEGRKGILSSVILWVLMIKSGSSWDEG